MRPHGHWHRFRPHSRRPCSPWWLLLAALSFWSQTYRRLTRGDRELHLLQRLCDFVASEAALEIFVFFICGWWSLLDFGNKSSSLSITNARSSYLNVGYTLLSTALLSCLSNLVPSKWTVMDLFVFIGLGSFGWFGHFLETDWLKRVAQLRSSLLLEVLIQIFDRFRKDQDIMFIGRGLSGTLSVWEATTNNHNMRPGDLCLPIASSFMPFVFL